MTDATESLRVVLAKHQHLRDPETFHRECTSDVLRETQDALASALRGLEAAERPWQACPVCGGRGNVMRGFYDGPGPKSSDGTTQELCRTCRGATVIHLAALAQEEKDDGLGLDN